MVNDMTVNHIPGTSRVTVTVVLDAKRRGRVKWKSVLTGFDIVDSRVTAGVCVAHLATTRRTVPGMTFTLSFHPV